MLLVVDYDETITKNDTLSILANLSQIGDIESLDVNQLPKNATWEKLGKQYIEEISAHWKSYPVTRSTFQDELYHWNLSSQIERDSLRRVGNSGILKGLTREQLLLAGRKIAEQNSRPGCLEFLRHWKQHHGHFIVLSVNWSRDMIQGTIGDLVNPHNIISNDLIFENGISTGYVTESIMTAVDKRIYLLGLKDDNIIYVGDSKNDLPALLTAKYGIIIGSNATLLDTCMKFAFQVTDDVSALPQPPSLAPILPIIKKDLLFGVKGATGGAGSTPDVTPGSDVTTPNRSGAVTPQPELIPSEPVSLQSQKTLYRVDDWHQIANALK